MKPQKVLSVNLLILALVLLTLPGLLTAGVTGKIAGKVTDADVKNALPGANVVIEGTMMGAATNQNGEFVIINVPPGNYTVRAQYIGYRPVTIKNVLVSVDLTTTVNFELPSEALELSSVVIVAERPLVEKNATNEVHVMTSNGIAKMPLRDYVAAVATNSGAVTARADFHVRGGRRDEVAYYVDGVYTNDLRTGVFLPLQTFNEYELHRANVLGTKFDMTHQIGLVPELRTGFEYRYHTMRRSIGFSCDNSTPNQGKH